MKLPCWLTIALRYLHARMAALRVLGPSSVWFLAAVARMSRASSSGDRGCSVFAVLCVGASTSHTGASLVLGRSSGITNAGRTRHPSKKYMPGSGLISCSGPACARTRPVRALYNPDGRQTYVGRFVRSAAYAYRMISW